MGAKSTNKHSMRNAKASGNTSDVLALLKSLADSEDKRGNTEQPRRDPETTVSEGIVAPIKRLKSLLSGSLSSSDYSSEDFIQVDPKAILKSMASAIATPNDVSGNNLSESEHDSESSTGSTSQVSDLTHESVLYSTSPTESPSIQVMERPTGFVSNRIPSSVFASRSPTPTEWSIASNESLFSIHIGNTSCSKERILKLSGEIHKSGEFPKYEESYRSSELFSFSPPPPVIRGRERERKNVNMGRNFGETGVTDKTIEDAPMEMANDQSKEKLPAQELPLNHHSYGNGTCIQSFVIPKKKKHVWLSCFCFSCRGLCCCARPNCDCCKWLSCGCFKWPSCRCYKLSSCRCCKLPSCSCCKWPSCGCCCKWPSCSCCCKWLSCTCCKWPSCSYSKCLSCSCCKLPSCGNCGCLNCNCCKWPSCKCSKWPSCRCCKWPSCKCWKWPSCSCCKWPSCSCSTWSCCCCCKCPSSFGCSWLFCCFPKRKRVFCCSSKIVMEGEPMQRHSEPKTSKVTAKPASKKWFSCFCC